MELNLRQAITQQVHGKTTEELHEIIQDSINGEDLLLPGLGVLFEIIWTNCGQKVQDQLVQTLHDHLN